MAPAVVLLVLFAVGAAAGNDAAAARCRVCGFGPSQASQPHCVPNAGIVGFNSVPPQTPAYWDVHVSRIPGRRGRLAGRVRVWADYTVGRPDVPGLPAACDAADGICFGADADLRGRVVGDRFHGVARYPDGARCEFGAVLDFGLGATTPNRYACHARSGELMSDGPLRVQLLRLLRCRR